MPPVHRLVCFNLKLDVLRGDLGLPAFPPKDVHHNFLCKVKPVYYMRPRSYSLSLSVAPFLIAYSGVLFRRYPEEWQTLLDRGKSSYRRVANAADRPNLGTFKSQLTAALKLADEKAARWMRECAAETSWDQALRDHILQHLSPSSGTARIPPDGPMAAMRVPPPTPPPPRDPWGRLGVPA